VNLKDDDTREIDGARILDSYIEDSFKNTTSIINSIAARFAELAHINEFASWVTRSLRSIRPT